MKDFAETGSTEILDKDPQLLDERQVLDGFTAPPIEEGVGKSHVTLFVDGNHTMVSPWWKKNQFFYYLCVEPNDLHGCWFEAHSHTSRFLAFINKDMGLA